VSSSISLWNSMMIYEEEIYEINYIWVQDRYTPFLIWYLTILLQM
jgi:hypothetical protein